MRGAARGRAVGAALFSIGLLGALAPGDFRFSRPVSTRPGWSRLELPDDVLDACRPGLPDLRLTDAGGREIPFAFEDAVAVDVARFPLADVESAPKRETIALLDRGAGAAAAQAANLEIAESEFLKPVVLEASEDRIAFREIARGSLFAAPGARSTTLRFAPNDRRFWRFRFDDRNGDPIHPSAVRVEPAGAAAAAREIALPWSTSASEAPAMEIHLPAANLGVSAVRLSVREPAFERPARVYERIFFRDEVVRRLVGAGLLRRAPGGQGETEIPVCDPAGRTLQVEIDNGDGPPLTVTGLAVLARRRAVLFYDAGRGATLLYASPSILPPRYDMAAALSRGFPPAPADASLGAPREIGAPRAVLPAPRGAVVDPSAWRTRRPIRAALSDVAYLDLSGRMAGEVASIRIVDGANRQIPYVVETGARSRPRPAALRTTQREGRTIAELSGLDPAEPPDAVTLSAAGPEFFSREVRVVEIARDARGPAQERLLGAAHWERQPGATPAPLTIPIAPPQERVLSIEIENGDNAPVILAKAQIHVPFVRLDFVPPPGESLTLLSDNPQASAPRYDLAMLAERVLAAPARPAALGPAAAAPPQAALPKWFWAAVAAAALLVALALVRTLGAEDRRDAD